LGYFGWIDYIMDVPLIDEVARLRPDWHWVFIGGKSNLVQISAANVHFLGPKPYSELPRYLRHIDICVLPWRQDHEFTNYGSAIKVREYLASGKPVVMSPLYEYLKSPGIRTYRSAQEFIAAVEDALSHDTPSQRDVRQNSVRNCTWDTRTQELAGVIVSLLRNGNPAI
jgi:glycosyltransferase involved in cell wall biosynthesis